MSETRVQNFDNHAVFPKTLFGATLVLLAGVILSIVGLFKVNSIAGICLIGTGSVLTGLATIFGLGVARRYATITQDRIIRLEMRLRLSEILPLEMRADIMRLSTQQLVGLRFASDDEMPELVRWALSEDVQDAKPIKQKVSNWQADFERV